MTTTPLIDSEQPPDGAHGSLRSALRVLGLATVFLYLVLGTVIVLAFIDSQRQRTALCNLRQDKQLAVRASRAFLEANPDGLLDNQGKVIITDEVIARGIRDQQRTIDALEILGCTPPPPEEKMAIRVALRVVAP